MILIDVEDYCHRCLDFTPDVTKPTKVYLDNGKIIQDHTFVRCEYRKRCAGIKRYLEQQMKGETNG